VSTFPDALGDLPEHDPEKPTRHSDRAGAFVACLTNAMRLCGDHAPNANLQRIVVG
jgi:hypothetical protein